MSLHTVFAGSREEPPEYEYTEPIECVHCEWEGDRDYHLGDYHVLSGIPANYLYAMSGDVICHDCSLYCEGCGDDLLDKGCFIGAASDGEHLFCHQCVMDGEPGTEAR